MNKFNVKENEKFEVEVKAGKGFDVAKMLESFKLDRKCGATPVLLTGTPYDRTPVGARPIERVPYKCGVRGPRNHTHKYEGRKPKKTRSYERQPQSGVRVYTPAPPRPELQHSLTEMTYTIYRLIDGDWAPFSHCMRWTDETFFGAVRMRDLGIKAVDIAEVLERTKGGVRSKFYRVFKEKKWDSNELPQSMRGKHWTDGEVKILRNMRAMGYDFGTIATVLARPRAAVYMKYRSL